MMSLYAIRNDGLKFKALDLTSMDVVNNAPEEIDVSDIIGFHRQNTSMKTWWKTPETRFEDIKGVPTGAIPDISLWSGGAGSSLVLSPKAYRTLKDSLQAYGEFLPVEVAGETYHIFNCLTFGDVDDAQVEREYVDGTEFGLKHIGFKDSVNNLLVFKTTIDGCMTL